MIISNIGPSQNIADIVKSMDVKFVNEIGNIVEFLLELGFINAKLRGLQF